MATQTALVEADTSLSNPQDRIAAEFEPLFAQLERERDLSDAIREKSKELDRLYRTISSLLNGVHSTKGTEFGRLVERTGRLWAEVRGKVRELAEMVPEDGFFSCKSPSSLRGVRGGMLTLDHVADVTL